MRKIVCYLVILCTSYLLIEGLIHPEDIGGVYDHGKAVQPDTFLIRLSGWAIVLGFHALAWIYLVYWPKKVLFEDFLNEKEGKP